jgi:hypothetical protein
MKIVRETIEWSYALVKNKFAVLHAWKQTKLDLDADIVLAEIRIMHLLTNCHTCLNSNQIGNAFGLGTPELEEYLRL